jgi:hypothetical protein
MRDELGNSLSSRCLAGALNCSLAEPFVGIVTKPTKPLEPSFGSELPTQPALEQSILAARLAARALAKPQEADGDAAWCDSEAPTGVEAERPLFPPSPRPPRI